MAKILVVDDDSVVLDLVQDILRLRGHQVDTASNGAQAVERVRGGGYDLVIMDRRMPVMDGLEAIRIIRRESRFRGLAILMFTAASQAAEIAEGIGTGANGYLAKPIDLKQFSETIQAILKSARP